MKLRRCSNHHYYDGDLYDDCPRCKNDLKQRDVTDEIPLILYGSPYPDGQREPIRYEDEDKKDVEIEYYKKKSAELQERVDRLEIECAVLRAKLKRSSFIAREMLADTQELPIPGEE